MRVVATAELLSLVRFYSDMADATTRATDDEVKRELDFGMDKYWNLLTKRLAWVEIKEYQFTGTNTFTYVMPAHGRTISVDIQNGEYWVPLHRADPFMAAYRGRAEYPIEYCEYSTGETQTVRLYAKQSEDMTGKTFRLRYFTRPPYPSLGETDDGVNFPSGWEEIPVLWAAIRLLARDQEDSSQLMALLQDAIGRMEQECDNLDIYQGVKAKGGSQGGVFWSGVRGTYQ